jgi:hypothetical protein
MKIFGEKDKIEKFARSVLNSKGQFKHLSKHKSKDKHIIKNKNKNMKTRKMR